MIIYTHLSILVKIVVIIVRSQTLVKHKSSVHDGVKFQCKSCEYDTKDKDNLKRHSNSVYLSIRYACDTYEFAAVQKSKLKQHQKKHLGIKYKCSESKFQTSNKKY